MLSLRKWGRLPDFEAVLRRFPVATLTMAVLTLHLMVEGFSGSHFETWIPGYLFGWYLCVGVQLASESRGCAPKWLPVLKLALVAAAIALSAFEDTFAFFPVLAVLSAVVFLGNFAWWGRPREDEAVWLWTQRMWTGAAIAAVGSAIFAVGTLAISVMVEALFGLPVQIVATKYLWPLGLAFLAPVYWMNTIPHPRESISQAASFEVRALGFLGTWLLVPLALIYGLIIVVYALQVLITWSLPDGQTALLVTPFLVVGTLIWLVLQPRLCAGTLIRLYHRLWFPVALVASLLLAVAIWVRVAEYALTPARVQLAALTLAALILAAWFIFTRRRDIRIPTAVAAGFLVASGFLAKPLADVTQLLRLEAALANPDKAAAAKTVQGAVNYLGGYRGQREEWLRNVFPDADDVLTGSEWEDYVRRLGYVNSERDRELARVKRPDFVYYGRRDPVDLSATPILLGKLDLYIEAAGSRRTYNQFADPKTDALVRGASLSVPVDGQVVRAEITPAFEAVYASRGSSPLEDPDTTLVVFDFQHDGRRMRLVADYAMLQGNGKTLSYGNGEALLFSEP